MKAMRFSAVAIMTTLAALSVSAEAASKRTPVMIGGHADLDACMTIGHVARLGPTRPEDPKSGFLSVRSGPGGNAYFETDRVHNGDEVIICETSGPWHAIIYPNRGQSFQDCYAQINVTLARRVPYQGSCRSGWVHERYIEITAG